MKILLTLNKTLTNGSTTWIDYGYWNVYLPLKDLGHEVYLYDTVDPEEKDYSKVVDEFRPDLIFCCLTNNRTITPYEPWEQLENYTKSGLVKTFNWFCDDTWRFDDFSKFACHYFTACSTPELSYIEKFKNEANYQNILLGLWHANMNLYPSEPPQKTIDVMFCGNINKDRHKHLEAMTDAGVAVHVGHGLEYQNMLLKISEARLGINFSKNLSSLNHVFQLKARMFEVPAAQTLLITEYAPGLETCFAIDKEIITFVNIPEMVEKIQHLLQNPKLVESMAQRGHQRFLKDHQSHIRLANLLGEIQKI
jgi:spore maturation protein CgeB